MLDFDSLRPLLALPGHLALCAMGYNRLHSLPISKKIRDIFEKLLILWAATLVIFGSWLAICEAIASRPEIPKLVETFSINYFFACLAAIAWVAFFWGWRKCTRRVPPMLLSNHTRSFDVAREIGHRPVGRLLSRLATRVPGNEFLDLDVNVKTLALPNLSPAADGLSITHLTDLHFTGHITRGYFDYAMEQVRELDSDLIAVTGDIVDKHELIQWVPETLGRMHARGGKFYVLGNHDRRLPKVSKLREAMNAAGLVDLGSSYEEVRIDESRILLCGNELVWFGPPPEPPALESQHENRPLRILLSHSPDQLAWGRRHQFELMLAGHTHGGQICLPLFGPVIAPSRFGVKYASGVYHEEPTLMHVSRGISAEHPFRFNCRPELTKIVLRCAERNGSTLICGQTADSKERLP